MIMPFRPRDAALVVQDVLANPRRRQAVAIKKTDGKPFNKLEKYALHCR
jgi:hypothetical protein